MQKAKVGPSSCCRSTSGSKPSFTTPIRDVDSQGDWDKNSGRSLTEELPMQTTAAVLCPERQLHVQSGS
jgi:hypothetical protein